MADLVGNPEDRFSRGSYKSKDTNEAFLVPTSASDSSSDCSCAFAVLLFEPFPGLQIQADSQDGVYSS